MSANLYRNLAVNQEVALSLAIFYSMTYRQLIDHKALTLGTYIQIRAQRTEYIGIVYIYLVGLLHLGHRLIVGIQQMQQFGPLHTRQIAQHRIFVQFQIRGQFGDIYIVRHIIGQKQHHRLELARVGRINATELRHLLIDDKAHHILYAAVVFLFVAIVEGVVACTQILLEQGLGMTHLAHLIANGISIL